MEWISVKDRLPEFGTQHRYLFINGKSEVTFGYAVEKENIGRIWIVDIDRETNEIATHWMNLPEKPNNKDENLQNTCM